MPRYLLCSVLYCVSPCIAPKGPFVLLSRSELPPKFPPGPQSSQAQPRPVHDYARHRSTSQCTARPGQACQSTTAWAGSYVPVWEFWVAWVVWVVYRSSPPQYSIESFALIIFHGHWHWHWTGAISRSSPPRHSLPLPPCCPLSTLYLFPSRRPVSHCSLMPRECGKTSIGGSTSRVRDETAQNTPEPTPPFLVILSSQEFPTLSSGCTTVHPIYADTGT